MAKSNCKKGIFIPAGRKVWQHELRVTEILAKAGYSVDFLPENRQKSPDILLNGIEFEIKSPQTTSTNTLEHLLKKGLKQSPNLIIDTSRTSMRDDKMRNFLVTQMRKTKQIKKLLMITKKGRIIDIFKLI